MNNAKFKVGDMFMSTCLYAPGVATIIGIVRNGILTYVLTTDTTRFVIMEEILMSYKQINPNFNLSCECGAEKTDTFHSNWCQKYKKEDKYDNKT